MKMLSTDWQTNWWNICFTDWLCEDTRMGDSGDLVVCFSAVVMTLRIMLSVVSAMHINIYYAVIVFIWPRLLGSPASQAPALIILLRYSSLHWEAHWGDASNSHGDYRTCQAEAGVQSLSLSIIVRCLSTEAGGPSIHIYGTFALLINSNVL